MSMAGLCTTALLMILLTANLLASSILTLCGNSCEPAGNSQEDLVSTTTCHSGMQAASERPGQSYSQQARHPGGSPGNRECCSMGAKAPPGITTPDLSVRVNERKTLILSSLLLTPLAAASPSVAGGGVRVSDSLLQTCSPQTTPLRI